jgi:hypothetical protein
MKPVMQNKLKFVFRLLIIISLCVVAGCRHKHVGDIPVVTVGDKVLYQSDLKGIIKKGMSSVDSISLIKSYIDKWIRRELLIEKAELNLTSDDKDVDKEIEDYRASLLIYRYEQGLINQKLDTIVRDDEIEKYYNENQNNFTLPDALVKAVLVKVPSKASGIAKVAQWMKSDKPSDLQQLESFCFQNAKMYDHFNDDWVYFDQLLQNVPLQVTDKNQFLSRNRDIQVKDSLFSYFVHIKEYKAMGTIPPVRFVKENIRDIILNKRKLQFISEVENNIYNDALNHKKFKIHEK